MAIHGSSFISDSNRNIDPRQAGYAVASGCGPCAPTAANGVRLVSPQTCKGSFPPYAGSFIFSNTQWSEGPPRRAALNQLATEMDQSSYTMVDGVYNIAGGYWAATIVPTSAADPLQGQQYAFAGAQITSSDTRMLITNVRVEFWNGSVVAAAPAPVKRNSVTYDAIGAAGVTNMYVVAPLLQAETSSQRVLLAKQTMNFIGAPTQDGIEVRVYGPANNAAYQIRAFLINRGITASNSYTHSQGA